MNELREHPPPDDRQLARPAALQPLGGQRVPDHVSSQPVEGLRTDEDLIERAAPPRRGRS